MAVAWDDKVEGSWIANPEGCILNREIRRMKMVTDLWFTVQDKLVVCLGTQSIDIRVNKEWMI
jgi:hypothetical protein